MLVRSVSGTVSDSVVASSVSKRQSSTFVACSENSAKFTPEPSQVAPSGYGDPGQALIGGSLYSVILGFDWGAAGLQILQSRVSRSIAGISIENLWMSGMRRD